MFIIRMISRFIGNLTASFEAVPEGRLYYRHLEWCKSLSLDLHNHDYDVPCFISEQAREEIIWWIENVEDSFANIITEGNYGISKSLILKLNKVGFVQRLVLAI